MANVVLISTYDMGRQPFALASAVAWLRERTGARVDCLDLDLEPMREELLESAHLAAFYLPMHTATRLTLPLLEQARAINPSVELCCFGLYAQLNEETLREKGVRFVLGKAFEPELVRIVRAIEHPRGSSSGETRGGEEIRRQMFITPDRRGLPELARYARLVDEPGASKVVGYTETTRGCKHMCRHCPVVPVYGGTFQVVQREVVLADIAQQVAAGAEHITFGDPDFFNGPSHGIAVVEALHRAHPSVSYDVTIKVEHLLGERKRLPRLKETGCVFVTTAVESLDDGVLALLEKGHTRADFVEALKLCRELGLNLSPTFLPFTPWTTPESYLELLDGVADLGLADHVPPIQFALRLLITASSRLLELKSVRELIAPFDPEKLVYPWRYDDPRMERLAERVMHLVHSGAASRESRRETFGRIRLAAAELDGGVTAAPWEIPPSSASPPIFVPHLTEDWFC